MTIFLINVCFALAWHTTWTINGGSWRRKICHIGFISFLSHFDSTFWAAGKLSLVILKSTNKENCFKTFGFIKWKLVKKKLRVKNKILKKKFKSLFLWSSVPFVANRVKIACKFSHLGSRKSIEIIWIYIE